MEIETIAMADEVTNGCYQNIRCKGTDHITSPLYPYTTLADLFLKSCETFSNQKCLGTRKIISKYTTEDGFEKITQGEYEWDTYETVKNTSVFFSRGLKKKCQLEPQEKVAIYADTKSQWLTSVNGCFLNNYTVVTCYTSLGVEALVHCLNETESKVVIVDAKLYPKIFKVRDRLEFLKHVIVIGASDALVECEGISIVNYVEVVHAGMGVTDSLTHPGSSDLAFIMYTSGSTGVPKGVMITHSNVIASLTGIQDMVNINSNDVYLGYLPLAHILELIAEHLHIMVGAKIGYGSPHTLTDSSVKVHPGSKGDASELKPSLMAAVPAVMDKIRRSVEKKMSEKNVVIRTLFDYAYQKKKWLIENNPTELPNFVYQYVLNKIKKSLGGRVRAIISGGAPLSKNTQEFMRVCFDVPILQGYGLTETCSGACITPLNYRGFGKVGPPLVCNYIKLIDWEEGGYFVSDRDKFGTPRGEILVGGGNVTLGYYKNTEKTAEDYSTDKDGMRWFHTGDIGRMHLDGCLEIIDRKKDLVKLTCGEYVSLGKVESILKLSPYVENVMVYAPVQPVVDRAMAIVSLSPEYCEDNSDKEYTGELKAKMDQNLKQVCKEAGLKGFEIPEQYFYFSESWTPENDLVTAALKLKRENLKKYYQSYLLR
jgi:long-chain acyl-CoA synthetase